MAIRHVPRTSSNIVPSMAFFLELPLPWVGANWAALARVGPMSRHCLPGIILPGVHTYGLSINRFSVISVPLRPSDWICTFNVKQSCRRWLLIGSVRIEFLFILAGKSLDLPHFDVHCEPKKEILWSILSKESRSNNESRSIIVEQ